MSHIMKRAKIIITNKS